MATCFACGCAAEREPVESPLDLPEGFSESGGAAIETRWWRVFGDGDLDAMIEAAANDNLDVKIAWSRVAQAEAVLKRDGADRYPQVNARAGADVGYRIADEPLGGPFYGISLGVAASYEIDLWSRVASQVEAAEIDVEVARADVGAAAVTISGEIAVSWFQLVAARAELEILEEQVTVNEQWLELVELRYGYGKASAADVLRQRQQIEGARSSQLLVSIRIETLENRLAALVGQTPDRFSVAPVNQLPDPPGLPATGVPSEVLQRRPDVQAAMLRVQAADARVAVAVADQYPQLTIGAEITTSTADVTEIFTTWLFGLGVELVAPLIDGGRRAAEVERTEAVLDSALYTYGAVLLDAVVEVEDSLAALRHQVDLVESLERQLELADAAQTQAQVAYANGGASYLDVLDTVRTQQALERSLLAEQLELLLRHVDLHRALGGGWEIAPPGNGEES